MAQTAAEIGPTHATGRLGAPFGLSTDEPGAEITRSKSHRDEIDSREVDRLVRLTFTALLQREPDRDTMLAYREGFANGSTFRDLVDDVMGSDEYRDLRRHDGQRRATPSRRDEVTPGDDRSVDLTAAVALLAVRLSERGCSLHFASPVENGLGDEDRRRVCSLVKTLSVLDRL